MPLFYGKSMDMTFKPDNTKAWLDYLISVDKKKLVVEIDKEYGVRSDNQNRYYWSSLEIIANHTGHTSNELHEYFKRVHLPPQFKKILGTDLKLPSSTKGLSKIEFGVYFEKIRAEVALLGITLPDAIKDEAPLRK